MSREFNTRFFNPSFYSDTARQPSPMLLDQEENRNFVSPQFEDVLALCMSTDACKQLGMSFFDFFKLDTFSYMQIKEQVKKDVEAKAKISEQVQKDLNVRREKLNGDK